MDKVEIFLKNMCQWALYGLLFCLLLGIAIPTLSTREYVGYSLILGFFAGQINNLTSVIKDFIENKYCNNNWYGD